MTTRLIDIQGAQEQIPPKGLARWPFLLKRFQDNTHIYKRFGRYIRPYWPRVVLAILLTIPAGSLDAAVAFALRPYMDGVLTKNTIVAVGYVPLIIIGFTLVQGLFTYFAAYLNGWIGYRIGKQLRSETLQKIQELEPAFFEMNDVGTIIQRVYADTFTLQDSALQNIRQFLTRLFSSLFLSAVLLWTSWKLALIALGILATIIYPTSIIRKILRDVNTKMVTVAGEFLTFYAEQVQMMKLVYIFDLLKNRQETYAVCEKDYGDHAMKILKASAWLSPSTHFVSAIGVAAILWQGTQMVVSDTITVGAFVSFLTALLLLYNPLKSLGNTLMQVQTAFMAAERLFAFIDIKPTIQDKPNAVELDAFKTSITFENVSFAYTPGQPVLKEFNLCINKNETIALVGQSGGGKSTIANLIPRFYDIETDHGTIKIDGQDIRSVTMASLRKQISLVMQDSQLFRTTLKENIRVGKPNATDEEVWAVLDKVHLSEFVRTLENGLDHFVNDPSQFSGGQKQRISIARALLKNAPIFILDEATSALDSHSEAIIQNAVEELMQTKTVIVIAHRLSTIRKADKVLVLAHGKIVESGTHEELLNNDDGTYRMLYQTQFADAY